MTDQNWPWPDADPDAHARLTRYAARPCCCADLPPDTGCGPCWARELLAGKPDR